MRKRECIWIKHKLSLAVYEELKVRGKAFRELEQQRKNKNQ